MAPRPTQALGLLHGAIKRHDLEAFVARFAADYRSEQPAHPAWGFAGSEQVRKNWATFFEGVPDLRAELLGATEEGDSVWAEWRWRGTRRDRTPLDMRGVTLFGVPDDRIVWGRLYMEEAEAAGADSSPSLVSRSSTGSVST